MLSSQAIQTIERADDRRVVSCATEVIPDKLIADMLAAYREPCRFLQRAEFDLPGSAEDAKAGRTPWIAARGDFDVTADWYIQSTGHFNAVDCVLCFNQLGYVAVAQALQVGRFSMGEVHSAGQFRQRMLEYVLIAKIDLRFEGAIEAGPVRGTFDLHRLRRGASRYIATAKARFVGERGGSATADALLIFATT